MNWEAGYFHFVTPLKLAGVDYEATLTDPPWQALFVDPVLSVTLSVGLSVRVLPRGIFLFDFAAWKPELFAAPQDADARLALHAKCASFLNAHLACLYSTIFAREGLKGSLSRHMEVSAFDVLLLRRDQPSNPSALTEMSPVGWSELIRQLQVGHDTNTLPVEVKIETIQDSLSLFNQLVSFPEDQMVITVVDILLRARRALEESDYVVSLTLAWSAAERLLNTLWDRYLQNNRERVIGGTTVHFINSERKERLMSRDYTASVKSEVLSLADVLPFEMFENFTRARKARNDWLHGLTHPTREDASAAISSVRELFRLLYNIELRWGFVFHAVRDPA